MRWVLGTVLAVALLWCAGFLLFLGRMALPAEHPDTRTDALIVLTGGSTRVAHGFELLARQSAPVLFISGVGANVTRQEMLAAHATPAMRERIAELSAEVVFDYNASSTQTNASEAASFVRERQYRSVRLITAHYHMPRSMMEFQAALPGVIILREPVVPERLASTRWWNDASGRMLVVQEFHKYLAARGRIWLQRV
jgi:uncharacterized SAM-binding protein YcdF (DUF218 family)